MIVLKNSSLPLLGFFARNYPRQSLTVVTALVLAGFAETVGIGALLPLITIVVGSREESGGQIGGNALEDLLGRIYESIGLAPGLEILLATIVVMILVKNIIVFLALRYAGFVAADISRALRLRLMRALMRARWTCYSRLPVGMVSNAISSEAERAGQCYMLAGRTIASIIQVLVYVLAALLVSWQISVLALVMGSTLAWLIKGIITMARQAGQAMTGSMNTMLAGLNDAMTGVKALRAMGLEERFAEKFDRDSAEVCDARKKQYESAAMIQVIYEPVLVVLLAGGLYYLVGFTDIPVAEVLLLALLFYRLMGHAGVAQRQYQNMVQVEPSVWFLADKSAEIEQVREEIPDRGVVPDGLRKAIRFDNVSLAYDQEGQNAPVLSQFTDSVPAGKITVIFGPSGVGKTTLIDSVIGLIKPASGQIMIDDEDISGIDILRWREMIGYVPQETILFHDTIRQNITLGDEKLTDDAVHAALRKAAAEAFIKSLPEGLDTIAGERGSRFSGGQRQRIALARALVRKPALLVLDEATSGLDRDSERQVLETVKELASETTIVMISHNPAVLDIADHVIDLQTKKA